MNAAVVIGFYGGLRGEELFIRSLKVVLKFWEGKKRRKKIHIMVTLKGRFKGETEEKCHMLKLAGIIKTGIEVRKWVGRWL